MTKGLLPHVHVVQAALNAVAYSQATIQCELEKLNCMTWINDIVIWSTDFDNLLNSLDVVMERLEHGGCM